MSRKTITKMVEQTGEFIICDKCSNNLDLGHVRPFMYEFLPKGKDLCDPCFMSIIREGIEAVFPSEEKGKDNV